MITPVHPNRLVYLGTPDDAVPPLRALVDAGLPVDLVVTRADKRRRRNRPPEPSPVKAAALDLGLPVTDRLDDVCDADADLGVVVAYGRIIPADLLDRLPMINLHFSLLPRWRGAAPVERAILAGDDVTGVCVMQVVPELDAGAVYASREVPIGAESAAELRSRLVATGSRLLVDTVERGLADPVEQRGEVTYAEKITPDDLHLDWQQPAVDLGRMVRVGRAWTSFRGERLLVHEARVDLDVDAEPGRIDGTAVGTGRGALVLERVQPAGRKAVDAADWVNGARPGPDERLGEPT